MKKTIQISLLILLSSYNNVKSQMVIGTGVSNINLKSVGFNLQGGYTFGKVTDNEGLRQNENYVYYSQTVNNARNDVPQIFALRYGRNLGTLQPYLGAAYHLGTTDVKNNKRTGFKPEYGITKYFYNCPLSLSIGRSGNINLITFGIYTVK